MMHLTAQVNPGSVFTYLGEEIKAFRDMMNEQSKAQIDAI